jgi:DNA-binding CsgD family transcriptional regulator
MLHIPPELVSMVKDYVSSSSNLFPDRQSTGWQVRNNWGSFVCKAGWFKKPLYGVAGQVVVTIQYQEPTLYRVLCRCDDLGLTVRQTEVTVGLFRGFSYDVISKNMCISIHTVMDHVKKIYDKLGIQSKAELHLVLVSTGSM